MATSKIPYVNTQTLSKLLQAFIEGDSVLESFYGRAPKLENFEAQMTAKAAQLSIEQRQILANRLTAQYKSLDLSPMTKSQIDALKAPTTFTVTTGHQLNLMGGPLYFLYKIISVVNLAKNLRDKYPDNSFIPVFWMASEDHDFKEINHFHMADNRLEWALDSAGPVGRLSTKGLDFIFDEFSKYTGDSAASDHLKKIFKAAYISQKNLADATRSLVHQLFGEDGVVVVDGDDTALKRLFVPQLKDEFTKSLLFDSVSSTNTALKSIDRSFKIQANPRQVNLFYILDDLRERIVQENGNFRVSATDISFDLESIYKEIEQHPERFSPNVLMRPLYQETILPNLSYTGGGGELAYWLQLKSYFEASKIEFPILMHRNSALVMTKEQLKDLEDLGLSTADLFLPNDALTAKVTKFHSQQPLDFSPQKNHLKKQFESLYKMAKQTDASFLGAVAAQEKKQLKGLSNLEKRLFKAEKRLHAAQIEKALGLKAALFPENKLQERHANFSSYYAHLGHDFIELLKSEFDPFQQNFYVFSL